MVVYTYKPSIWEIEASGSGVQGLSWLHSGFDASQGCLGLCLKKKNSILQYFMKNKDSLVLCQAQQGVTSQIWCFAEDLFPGYPSVL